MHRMYTMLVATGIIADERAQLPWAISPRSEGFSGRVRFGAISAGVTRRVLRDLNAYVEAS
jgi:hypothetical protein